jgi:stage V sporulation protein R
VNFKNRGELLLRHVHQGVDLDLNYAAETLKNIYYLWKRPVNISTTQEGVETFVSFDGNEIKTGS